MSLDRAKSDKTLIRWSRIDPDNPAGLHEPKKPGDVGWDLEAARDVLIAPGEAIDVPTNVRLHLPNGKWAEIRARSSIARRGLQVDAGTIDTGYRGPLFALVRNMRQPKPNELFTYRREFALDVVDFQPFEWLMAWQTQNSVKIEAGERVAQVVFHRDCPMWAREVEEIDLGSARGEAGFGSTGR